VGLDSCDPPPTRLSSSLHLPFSSWLTTGRSRRRASGPWDRLLHALHVLLGWNVKMFIVFPFAFFISLIALLWKNLFLKPCTILFGKHITSISISQMRRGIFSWVSSMVSREQVRRRTHEL